MFSNKYGIPKHVCPMQCGSPREFVNKTPQSNRSHRLCGGLVGSCPNNVILEGMLGAKRKVKCKTRQNSMEVREHCLENGDCTIQNSTILAVGH